MKQNKTQPFTYLGVYQWIDELTELVAGLSDEEWNEFTYRQKRIEGHGDTQTIPLMFDPEQKVRDIRHKHYEMFALHIGRLSGHLQATGFPNTVVRANLVKLFANCAIATHTDAGKFLTSSRRVHLPIQTNLGCTFTVGSETMHLSKGEIWEINNTGLPHSVLNGGGEHRVHLIVDVR